MWAQGFLTIENLYFLRLLIRLRSFSLFFAIIGSTFLDHLLKSSLGYPVWAIQYGPLRLVNEIKLSQSQLTNIKQIPTSYCKDPIIFADFDTFGLI